jgi:mannosyltransferase
MPTPLPKIIEVIAPNIKRRLSGVTATVVRLVPIQAEMIGIVTTGPGLPDSLPHLPLWRVALLPNDRWRVFHARRNIEMLLGIVLRHVLRRKFRLLFTSPEQRWHTRYTRWLMRRMDGIVATSPQAASYLLYPNTVVMHGVDTAVFHPSADKTALRRALNLPEGVLMGCFGRIRAQKGVDLLVDAAIRLMPTRPDLTLIFTGRVTGKEQEFYKAQQAKIDAAGLSSRIRFLGELPWDDLVKHYQALDLFVAPARWEGFGLTPLEAMSCGIPTVAATVGAYEALITPQTGSLVPPGDVTALTTALATWIDDPARRANADTRAHILRNHDIKTEAASLTAIYRTLIARGTLTGLGK